MAEAVEQQEQPVAAAVPALQPNQRATGTCKWFSAPKGYGFISPDAGGEDLFVHQTCIEAEGFRSLRPGEAVEFTVEVGEDGKFRAVKVTGPQGQAPQGMPKRQGYYPYYGEGNYYGYGYGYGYGYPGYPGRGRGYGRGMPFDGGRGRGGPGRGRYGMDYYGGYEGYPPMGGRGGYERRPPPGTPGVSSGLQVVVHNLPWNFTWQQLRDAFQGIGEIERADVIKDSNGNSRGFGIVRYVTEELANQAVEQLNNTEVGGRIVTVRIDKYA